MSWFDENGIEGAQPEMSQAGAKPEMSQVGANGTVLNPNNVGVGTGVAGPAQPGGFDRTQFRDAWQSSPGQQSIQDFIAKNPQFSQGVTPYVNPQTGKVSSDVYSLPTGETLDLSINSQNGVGGKGWTDTGHDSSGRAYAQSGGPQLMNGQSSSYGTGTSSTSGQLGTVVNLPTAPTYQPFQSTAPAVGQFAPTSSFGAPTPFQSGSNVPTPDRLTAQQLATPDKASYTNFDRPPGFVAPTAEEASRDQGYQFRQASAAQALEQSAAAKGMLRTNNTWQGLQDQAGNLASQEYGNVYNRRLGESQMDYNQGFQTNQANNAGNLAVNQANAQTGLAYGQANNSNALAFGQANNQATAAQQAAQYAQNANTYGMNQQAQAQEYGQQNSTYANQLAGQNQNYTQQFNTNQANNAGQLGNYNAQVNAVLGQGNLALGYQNSNNSYSLGQQSNALGWGQLGQNQSQFNTNQNNWLNTNAWNQNMDVARLGNPGAANAQGFGQQQGTTYQNQGDLQASGQAGAANAWTQGLGQTANGVGNAYQQYLTAQQPPSAYQQWLDSQRPPPLS